MLPLRDTIRSESFPIVNTLLITLNVLVFLFEAALEPAQFETLLRVFGLVPARLFLGRPTVWITIFTSMFMHGSWIHLISNMWALYLFGDNVEDRMGSFRYLIFYLLSGVFAALTQVFFSPASRVPTVGASGAIAGVLGAYFVLFPTARVITLIPVFFLPWFVEISAYFYLGFWFLSQLWSGLLSLGARGDFGGIAWWAHVGGFVFGMLMVHLFARPYRRHRQAYVDEYYPW
ncbi:MAG TPA: rhomboid family intramembrane serine protease [Chloroflexi bacterium]|nr:rhomboid family intramembrane serine protease [Chloroflexota bacterium]